MLLYINCLYFSGGWNHCNYEGTGLVTWLHEWISNETITLNSHSVILFFPCLSPSGVVGSAVRFVYVCVNEDLALCRKGYASK